MKFVLIFGPQAVGKMTVGQALAEQTGLKLLHNHMTIDLLQPLFGFTEEMWKLSDLFRKEIFQAFSRTEEHGLIFTYLWAFNKRKDWEAVDRFCEIFRSNGADIFFVELEANVNVRLHRNKTANRLKHKPTKRNLEQSEEHLIDSMKELRLNSLEGELEVDHYIRINNTSLTPEETALMIKNKFNL